jgi:hypothetical protein
MNSRAKTYTALTLALMFAAPAGAQERKVQAPPPPPPPGVQRPEMNSTNQAIAALRLRMDALRDSVGRQVVVLHFPSTDLNSWPDAQNSFPNNNQRAESVCKAALGDRYGRVLSRVAQPAGDRWYFPNIVCETAP